MIQALMADMDAQTRRARLLQPLCASTPVRAMRAVAAVCKLISGVPLFG